MQHLEVSGAVRHIYIYVIRRLKVKLIDICMMRPNSQGSSEGAEKNRVKPYLG